MTLAKELRANVIAGLILRNRGWLRYPWFKDDSVRSYRSLWESINGPGSWDANPWVWCVSFRRVES